MTVDEFIKTINELQDAATSHHKISQDVRISINDELYDLKDIEIDYLMGCRCGVGLILVANT